MPLTGLDNKAVAIIGRISNQAHVRKLLQIVCRCGQRIKESEKSTNAGNDRAWYNLGLARNATGQIGPALEALNRAQTVAPDDARIPYASATILARAGRVAEAKAAAQRALTLQPDLVEAAQLLRSLSN